MKSAFHRKKKGTKILSNIKEDLIKRKQEKYTDLLHLLSRMNLSKEGELHLLECVYNDCIRIVENKINELAEFDYKQIKDVIFNDPATIVFWNDGTKTVVKCQTDKGDTYNPELGLAMCIIKRMCGNKGNYNNVFNKWLLKED